MCGIAGFVASDRSATAVRASLSAMTDAIRHRGPDAWGLEVIDGGNAVVGLGHRRLSIIDLSPAGRQPLTDGEGRWITYNGEIYNYRELRAELLARGRRFRTQTDTEVILAAFAEWDLAAIPRLRGIFAFGLWDGPTRRLVLVRDHLGVKPLYYNVGNGELLFGSEVRSLLAGPIERKLSIAGLCSYLAFGSVQEPHTLVEGVSSLAPGTIGIYCEGRFATQRYWSIPGESIRHDVDQAEGLAQLGALLQSTVASQLVSEVPLGVFLSGGIDSSLIAALAQRASRERVKTLSIVFDEARYDESKYARLAAEHIGSEHVELRLTGEHVRSGLGAALASFDQPSTDGLNTYFVSRLAREAGLTVALSGVGGDEVFGGYDEYAHVARVERWKRRADLLPAPVRYAASRTLNAVGRGDGASRLAALLTTTEEPYFLSRRVFTEEQTRTLLDPGAIDEAAAWDPRRHSEMVEATRSWESIARVSSLEMQTYMLSTLLRDADQMSMAHALEVRVPLIDHELIEFVFSLPSVWRVGGDGPKPFLTKSVPDAVPRDCIYREKRGFELPFAVWLGGALRNELQAKLTKQTTADAWPFTPRSLEAVWRRFEQGRLRWSRVWSIFVLRDWLRAHRVTA